MFKFLCILCVSYQRFVPFLIVFNKFRYHKQYCVSCRIRRWNPPIRMCPDWGFQSTIMCYHAVFYAHFVWFFINDLSCAIVLFLVHFMCLLFCFYERFIMCYRAIFYAFLCLFLSMIYSLYNSVCICIACGKIKLSNQIKPNSQNCLATKISNLTRIYRTLSFT